jgi:hypothetical protein
VINRSPIRRDPIKSCTKRFAAPDNGSKLRGAVRFVANSGRAVGCRFSGAINGGSAPINNTLKLGIDLSSSVKRRVVPVSLTHKSN